MSRLLIMASRRIDDVVSIHDYWQILMGTARLTVFVPLKLMMNNSTVDPKQAIGTRIEKVIEDDCSVAFHLNDGGRIDIDFSPDQSIGPEAMTLAETGYPTVVW